MKRILILLGVMASSAFIAVNGFLWSWNISGFFGGGGKGTPELALADTLMTVGALGFVVSGLLLLFYALRWLIRTLAALDDG